MVIAAKNTERAGDSGPLYTSCSAVLSGQTAPYPDCAAGASPNTDNFARSPSDARTVTFATGSGLRLHRCSPRGSCRRPSGFRSPRMKFSLIKRSHTTRSPASPTCHTPLTAIHDTAIHAVQGIAQPESGHYHRSLPRPPMPACVVLNTAGIPMSVNSESGIASIATQARRWPCHLSV